MPLPSPDRRRALAGGVDLNKPRARAALAAALALATAPHGFTVAEFAARACQMTRHDGYTIRQAAYDPRKLRGKNLIDKPGGPADIRSPPSAARTIAALLALRNHVIKPSSPAFPQPPARTQTRPLDPHRCRLSDPPHRHAGPFRQPRDQHASSRRIDNILSIRECKLLVILTRSSKL